MEGWLDLRLNGKKTEWWVWQVKWKGSMEKDESGMDEEAGLGVG